MLAVGIVVVGCDDSGFVVFQLSDVCEGTICLGRNYLHTCGRMEQWCILAAFYLIFSSI